MPSNEIHGLIDKLLFGKDGKSIHRWMDEPYKWMGKEHRKVRHDVFTVAMLGMTKGKEAAQHAVSHIVTDALFTKGYNQMMNSLRKIVSDSFNGILKI